MNNFVKRFFIFATLINIANHVVADDCNTCCPTTCATGQNLYQPHAFSVSMSREIMLEKAAWYPMSDEEGWHGTFGVGFDFMRSFGGKCNPCTTPSSASCCTSLGSLPFWSPTNGNTMTIGDNSGTYNLDGYQMGLGPITTNGTVTLNPIVYQTGGDFLLYLGASKTERGFFFKAHAPIGVTNINPNLSYTDTITSVDYPDGSLNQNDATEAPYDNIKQAWAGNQTAGFLKRMVKGLISCDQTSSAKFGDAEFVLGYNLYADQQKHIGIAIRFSAPTGNKAQGIYVLEPIFGRNGHWGCGAEVIGHWKFWESDTADDRWAQLFFDGDVLHLFQSKHVRSFDLLPNGPGSKYMLVAKYIGNTAATATEFQSEIQNAVNITTIGVSSTFAAEGNFALGLQFHWGNFGLEIGYEGWGRTCEKLCIDCSCPGSVNYNEYAVLGRQRPYNVSGTFIGLCQPTATIGESANYSATATSTIVDACLSINRLPDVPELALDVEGQRARSVYTSKPYAELRYTWTDSDYIPYLAITGGAEIPNTHKNEAAKMWNVGLNGGIAF